LELERRVVGGLVEATVTGYDDAGEGMPIAGARVDARPARGGAVVSATTDSDGKATLDLHPRRYLLRASKRGLVRSFDVPVKLP
jgi:hypothetical protein